MKIKTLLILIIAMALSSCSRVERQYWDNGNIKSELPYRNGKLNGTARWYYEDGTIRHEVPYVDDRIEGNSIRYHDNGRKESEEEYVNNLRHGKAVEYTFSGLRIEQKEYVNDTLHGKYIKWHVNREVHITGDFVNGLFFGTWLYYDEYGMLIGEGRFEAGDGTQRFWYSDGSLRTRVDYVKNLRHGPEIHYFPDGSVEKIVEYDYGEIVGQRAPP
jgi:antitoxin component YwqK of YwqJK toxin-antitoxin module